MKCCHLLTLPKAYEIVKRGDGLVDVWLCRKIDTYITEDGIREYDADIRVVFGIVPTPNMEEDIRQNWEAWWSLSLEDNE